MVEVQAEAVAEVKAHAFQLLQPTDWRVIRQAEGGDALSTKRPPPIARRLRQASNDAETTIASAETTTAVRTIVEAVEWPASA